MPVGEQLIVFFLLMTAGFLLGLIFFLYNFFCRKVRLRHQGGADFLLWILLSLLFFLFLLWVNGGEFRFYVFIALALGLLAFKYAQKIVVVGPFAGRKNPQGSRIPSRRLKNAISRVPPGE